LDFARSFWLTANSFHSLTTDAANAKTSAEGYQTSTDSSTKYSQTSGISNLQ
jgi:hypothetical protein